MKKLQDKVALITGGTTGIGQATAKLFHAEGARVFITGRNEKTLAEAKEHLPADVTAIRSDASKLEDIDALAAELKDKAGNIDVLYVNAGVAKFMPFDSITPEIFDEMFNINVRGAYFTIQKLLPLMGEGSSVVLTTSIAADLGMATSSAYGATKAALSSFARTLSNELAPRGIRVNVVSPTILEETVHLFGAAFAGFEPVPAAIAAKAFRKSVEGAKNGETIYVHGRT